MLLRQHGDFAGGIDVPDEKRETLTEPIRACPLPERLFIPLALTADLPARCLVRPGQHVTAGERLAEASDGRPDVFAPTEGEVVATDSVADVEGFLTVPALELVPGGPVPTPPVSDDETMLALAPDELRRRIAGGHLSMFRRPMAPLSSWIDLARRSPCELLVANAMEDQPYVTSDHRLLAENGPDILMGLAVLARAMDVAQVALVVDHRRTEAYRHVVGLAESLGVQLIALPHKYPIGADVVLLKVLSGQEVPLGGRPLDIGAAVVDVATLLALCRWVRSGHRTAMRAVTVAGQQIVRPANYLTPFGTRCSDLAQLGARSLVHGGALTGLPCTPNAVVTPATAAVLGLGVSDYERPRTCIRCGWCTDHCPARLNVAMLNDAFELVDLVTARAGGVAACVHCGICSYVCPSRLPLTERVRDLRRAVQQRPERQRESTTTSEISPTS